MNNNFDPKASQEEVKQEQAALNAAEDQANAALGEPTGTTEAEGTE